MSAAFSNPTRSMLSGLRGPAKWMWTEMSTSIISADTARSSSATTIPQSCEAVIAQAAKGSHYGACHALELQWAEQVQRMIPSAERVRFTVTGTEATHLALRVARAFTGKQKIIRFAGHFHGWHDHVCFPGRRRARHHCRNRRRYSRGSRRMTWSRWSTGSLRAAISQP